VDVGTVWVVARHLLVAQALTAALDLRMPRVRAVPWAPEGVRGLDVDPDADVLLVVDDLDSPAAAEALREVLASAPARTVVMTGLAKGPAWGGLLLAGATEVISQVPSIDDLAGVVAKVCAAEPVMPEEERTALCQAYEKHVAEEQELLERLATLSPREMVVLQMLASGRRSAEIGEELGVTQSTVRTHIRSVRRKLGVDSQLRAVVILHRLGGRLEERRPGRPGPRAGPVPGMPSPRPAQE
jgi:DNA-binding NarL/FixJ family response regulator